MFYDWYIGLAITERLKYAKLKMLKQNKRLFLSNGTFCVQGLIEQLSIIQALQIFLSWFFPLLKIAFLFYGPKWMLQYPKWYLHSVHEKGVRWRWRSYSGNYRRRICLHLLSTTSLLVLPSCQKMCNVIPHPPPTFP